MCTVHYCVSAPAVCACMPRTRATDRMRGGRAGLSVSLLRRARTTRHFPHFVTAALPNQAPGELDLHGNLLEAIAAPSSSSSHSHCSPQFLLEPARITHHLVDTCKLLTLLYSYTTNFIVILYEYVYSILYSHSTSAYISVKRVLGIRRVRCGFVQCVRVCGCGRSL